MTSGPKERNSGLLGSDKNTITDGGINATHLKAISGRIKRIGSCLKRKLVFQDHLAVLEMLCGTCSLSVDSLRGDTAAGSLRVWLFIYQDQGWTLPDLVCPSTTLLRLLHYLPLHYLFARALHYLQLCTADCSELLTTGVGGKIPNKYEALHYGAIPM